MNKIRRQLMKGAVSTGVVSFTAASGLLNPTLAEAIELKSSAFGILDFDAIMKEMGGIKAEGSGGISITAPDLAENGAVVPVEVFSPIPNTDSIAILVEKNAIPLVAKFDFRNGTVGRIATRIKMAETSPVHAVVRADGKIYKVSRVVSVTISGCGFEPSPMKSTSEK